MCRRGGKGCPFPSSIRRSGGLLALPLSADGHQLFRSCCASGAVSSYFVLAPRKWELEWGYGLPYNAGTVG